MKGIYICQGVWSGYQKLEWIKLEILLNNNQILVVNSIYKEYSKNIVYIIWIFKTVKNI
jgi:hypothetical protein